MSLMSYVTKKMRWAKVHKKERIKNIEGKIINFAAKLFQFEY